MSTAENKMEMRGHENVVEAVVFVPVVAYAAIHELASIEVCFLILASLVQFSIPSIRIPIRTRPLGNTLLHALETGPSRFGVVLLANA